MANLGCPFVCTFGNYLAPVLIAAHTVNNVDFGDKNYRTAVQLNKQDEGYESDWKKKDCTFIRCDHHHVLARSSDGIN